MSNEQFILFYLDSAIAGGDFETSEKAVIPLGDAAVNTLRKHFVHGRECMKRATPGKHDMFSRVNLQFFLLINPAMKT